MKGMFKMFESSKCGNSGLQIKTWPGMMKEGNWLRNGRDQKGRLKGFSIVQPLNTLECLKKI